MKLSELVRIIQEEVQNYFSDWNTYDEPSMLDKYYEKKIGISTDVPSKEPEIHTKGDLIGYVTMQWSKPLKKPILVFKNPQSLNGFTVDARGILLKNDDIYLAESYNALHDNILDLLAEKGIDSVSIKI